MVVTASHIAAVAKLKIKTTQFTLAGSFDTLETNHPGQIWT